jgi:hypothetical protein
MNSRLGMFQKRLNCEASLAFLSAEQNSVYVLVYSNKWVKIELGLSDF